ncbi:uncharacterized protein LOC144947528 isoform X2 [Lampetra fluviatilis]
MATLPRRGKSGGGTGKDPVSLSPGSPRGPGESATVTLLLLDGSSRAVGSRLSRVTGSESTSSLRGLHVAPPSPSPQQQQKQQQQHSTSHGVDKAPGKVQVGGGAALAASVEAAVAASAVAAAASSSECGHGEETAVDDLDEDGGGVGGGGNGASSGGCMRSWSRLASAILARARRSPPPGLGEEAIPGEASGPARRPRRERLAVLALLTALLVTGLAAAALRWTMLGSGSSGAFHPPPPPPPPPGLAKAGSGASSSQGEGPASVYPAPVSASPPTLPPLPTNSDVTTSPPPLLLPTSPSRRPHSPHAPPHHVPPRPPNLPPAGPGPPAKASERAQPGGADGVGPPWPPWGPRGREGSGDWSEEDRLAGGMGVGGAGRGGAGPGTGVTTVIDDEDDGDDGSDVNADGGDDAGEVRVGEGRSKEKEDQERGPILTAAPRAERTGFRTGHLHPCEPKLQHGFCFNGGTCQRVQGAEVTGLSCMCRAGFSGQRCEQQTTPTRLKRSAGLDSRRHPEAVSPVVILVWGLSLGLLLLILSLAWIPALRHRSHPSLYSHPTPSNPGGIPPRLPWISTSSEPPRISVPSGLPRISASLEPLRGSASSELPQISTATRSYAS